MSNPFEETPSFNLNNAIDEAILEHAILEEEDTSVELLVQSYITSVQSNTRPRRNPQHRRSIHRDHVEGHNRLYLDYFVENPVYNNDLFRRRFRMRRHVFIRIVNELSNHYTFFTQKSDAAGRPGASPLQKCTTAIRALAYGVSPDALDEYLRMGETTIMDCVKKFAIGINECFGAEYTRAPNEEDMRRLLHYGESRGFPGMLGSVDCMHWQWEKCLMAWKGMYQGGHHGKATVVLEAVASFDTWIWHSFFGIPGSNNDINVIDKSPLFDEVLEGRAPEHKVFAANQESARKDVERAFGVLQARFAIVRRPARFWKLKTLGNVMRACIILHNMIVEDERDTYNSHIEPPLYDQSTNTTITEPQYNTGRVASFEVWLLNRIALRDNEEHERLQKALIEHIWNRFGGNYNAN